MAVGSSATMRPSRENEQALTPCGNARIVSNYQHRHAEIVQFLKCFHHLPSLLGRQIPGRFVGKQDGRRIGEGPCDGHTLLFTARQFVGPVLEPMPKADSLKQLAARRLRSAARTPA